MNRPVVKHTLAIVLVLLPALFLRLSFINSRPPLTHDEAITYLAAAGKQDDFQAAVADRSIYGYFLPAQIFKAFMIPDKPFDIPAVNKSMGAGDYHPPLYFWLLNFWIYFTGLNLQVNLILNLLISVVTCALIYAYAYYLTRSVLAAAASTLVFGTGVASIYLTGYLRHYELLAAVSTAFLFLLDYITREKRKVMRGGSPLHLYQRPA